MGMRLRGLPEAFTAGAFEKRGGTLRVRYRQAMPTVILAKCYLQGASLKSAGAVSRSCEANSSGSWRL
jgi:hypothetical protein